MPEDIAGTGKDRRRRGKFRRRIRQKWREICGQEIWGYGISGPCVLSQQGTGHLQR